MGDAIAFWFLSIAQIFPIISIITIINLLLRKYKPRTRLIANIVVIYLCIIISIIFIFRKDIIMYMSAKNLIEVVKNNDINQVNYILNSGNTDIDAKNKYGETVLMKASIRGDLEMVEYLVNNEAYIENIIDALKSNDTNRANSILKDGKAGINAKDKNGNTALMLASSYGHLEIVKLLVESGADINAKNNDGDNSLMSFFNSPIRYSPHSYSGEAAIAVKYEGVKYLLENGADINSKDKYGNTALMLASEFGRLEIVKLLVENGANINIKNKKCKTALDLAWKEEIKEILRESGAKFGKEMIEDIIEKYRK